MIKTGIYCIVAKPQSGEENQFFYWSKRDSRFISEDIGDHGEDIVISRPSLQAEYKTAQTAVGEVVGSMEQPYEIEIMEITLADVSYDVQPEIFIDDVSTTVRPYA